MQKKAHMANGVLFSDPVYDVASIIGIAVTIGLIPLVKWMTSMTERVKTLELRDGTRERSIEALEHDSAELRHLTQHILVEVKSLSTKIDMLVAGFTKPHGEEN